MQRRKNSAAPKILEAIDRIKWYPIILGGLYTIAIIHRYIYMHICAYYVLIEMLSI